MTDDGVPPFTDVGQLYLFVYPLRLVRLERNQSGGGNVIVGVGYYAFRYRLQYKDRLDAPAWTDLAGDVTLTSSTGVKTDSTAGANAERYYRIMQLP